MIDEVINIDKVTKIDANNIMQLIEGAIFLGCGGGGSRSYISSIKAYLESEVAYNANVVSLEEADQEAFALSLFFCSSSNNQSDGIGSDENYLRQLCNTFDSLIDEERITPSKLKAKPFYLIPKEGGLVNIAATLFFPHFYKKNGKYGEQIEFIIIDACGCDRAVPELKNTIFIDNEKSPVEIELGRYGDLSILLGQKPIYSTVNYNEYRAPYKKTCDDIEKIISDEIGNDENKLVAAAWWLNNVAKIDKTKCIKGTLSLMNKLGEMISDIKDIKDVKDVKDVQTFVDNLNNLQYNNKHLFMGATIIVNAFDPIYNEFKCGSLEKSTTYPFINKSTINFNYRDKPKTRYISKINVYNENLQIFETDENGNENKVTPDPDYICYILTYIDNGKVSACSFTNVEVKEKWICNNFEGKSPQIYIIRMQASDESNSVGQQQIREGLAKIIEREFH